MPEREREGKGAREEREREGERKTKKKGRVDRGNGRRETKAKIHIIQSTHSSELTIQFLFLVVLP